MTEIAEACRPFLQCTLGTRCRLSYKSENIPLKIFSANCSGKAIIFGELNKVELS